MASPVSPILHNIVFEALQRAGYGNPGTDLQARARDHWIEEIKSELWARARKLKSLQTRSITTLTKGLPQYSNPTDYASDMQMELITGGRYGTAQAGSTTTVTLASNETATEADLLGKEIAIYSGTGVGGISFVTAYNSGTKVVTFSPAVTTAPASGSLYVVIDEYRPIFEKPIWNMGEYLKSKEMGYPDTFYPIGDGSNGKFILSPTPYRSDSQPLLVSQRYYADLTEQDLSGTLLATLYQKWRPMWISGIRWKCLQNDDDNRAASVFQEYQKAIRDVISIETDGISVNGLQACVVDY